VTRTYVLIRVRGSVRRPRASFRAEDARPGETGAAGELGQVALEDGGDRPELELLAGAGHDAEAVSLPARKR
jgi:hypothetical protein